MATRDYNYGMVCNGEKYHVCKDIWATVVGEELPCKREDGSRADPFAVAVHGQRGGHHWPHSEEDIICLLYFSLGVVLLWHFSLLRLHPL